MSACANCCFGRWVAACPCSKYCLGLAVGFVSTSGTVGQSKTLVQGGKIPRYIGGARKTGLKTPVGGKTGLMHVTPGKKISDSS